MFDKVKSENIHFLPINYSTHISRFGTPYKQTSDFIIHTCLREWVVFIETFFC